MLVLSRRKSESIVINDNIILVVVDVRGDKVRLGVSAPPNVTVHRKEVYDEITRHGAIHAPVCKTELDNSAVEEEIAVGEKGEKTESAIPKTKPIAKKVIRKKS